MQFLVLKATVRLARNNVPLTALTCVRQRSSYYGAKKSYIPRFIKVFIYKHPASPFAVVAGLLVLMYLQPICHAAYARWKLDPEDYQDYRSYTNRIALDRARYGTDLFIPFTGQSDPRRERFEFFLKRTEDRRAGLKVEEIKNPAELSTKREEEELKKAQLYAK